jgi:large subunit ribosomal protein L24
MGKKAMGLGAEAEVMKKANVKKGDEVLVITGKDKGRRGKVVEVDAKAGKVIVEKINEYKKHYKPRMRGQSGEIMTIAMPLHISNVMVIDRSTNKPARVGRREVNGKLLRYAKGSGQLIDSE